MPPVGTVYHVPDHVVFVEHNVSFNLFILFGDEFHRRCRFVSRFLPRPTFATCVDDVRDVVNNFSRDPCGMQDPLHLRASRVPPSDVEFLDLSALLGFRSVS